MKEIIIPIGSCVSYLFYYYPLLLQFALCVVIFRFLWYLFEKSSLNNTKRNCYYVSHLVSVILISCLLCFGEYFSRLFGFTLLVSLFLLTCQQILRGGQSVSDDCKEWRKRYSTSLIFYYTLTFIWTHPYFCLLFVLLVVYALPYRESLRRAHYFVTNLNRLGVFVFSVITLLQIYLIDVSFVKIWFLDLCIFILLSESDFLTLLIIKMTVNMNLPVNNDDIEIMIAKWKYSGYSEGIGEMFLNLHESKKLTGEQIQKIVDIGLDNKRRTKSFVSILLSEMKHSNVNEDTVIKIKQDLLKHNNINKLNAFDTVDLSNFINESNKYILDHAIKIFADPQRDLNERLYVSNVLVKQLAFHDTYPNNYVDVFAKIALDQKGIYNKKKLMLSCVAFQSLHAMKCEQPFEFFKKYYTIKILPNLCSPALKMNELTTHLLDTDLEYDKRYHLLETLSILLVNGYKIDKCIFTNFQPQDWLREMLVYVLLGKAIEVDESAWNESNIKEYMRYIHLFYEIFNDSDDELSCANVIKALKCLINRQHEYKFNLSHIINILILLCTNNQNVDQFFNSKNFIKTLVDTEDAWLKTICIKKQLMEPNKDCKDDLNYLHKLVGTFEIRTVLNIFDKLEDNSSLRDLIRFFELLMSSQLTDYTRQAFINRLCSDSAYTWKYEVSKLIVNILIKTEFSNYISCWTGDILVKKSMLKIMKNKLSNKLNTSQEKQKKFFDISEGNKMLLNDQLKDKSDLGLSIQTSLNKIERNLCDLLCLGKWTVEFLTRLIYSLDTIEKVKELEGALCIITDYNLSVQQELYEIIGNSTTKDLKANVLQYAIRNTFLGTYDKSPEELLDEIQHHHGNIKIEFIKNLRQEFNEVCKAYDCNTLHVKTPIKNWKTSDVNNWISTFKQNNENNASQAEKIAVLKRALELTSKTKIKIRDVQIMSLLLFLNPANGKGRLAQINTGEGKTYIIALIAAFNGLHGHKVDVVTTSPVLAVPQCNLLEPFYSILNLTVSHNYNNPSGYKSDIVYGPIEDFQADILRDQCNKGNRRCGRTFDTVIVDEVDSMFIDGNDHIVMLSNDMPGMNHLQTLLAAIVLQIDNVASCIKQINGKPHFAQPKSRIKQDGSLCSEKEMDFFPLDCSVKDFIQKATEKHIRKLVRDVEAESGYPKIEIPIHLRDFVLKVQITEWIDSAIRAKYTYKDTKHYVIRKGKVMPVDVQNTGVVHENQHWSNGLHQFLQLKHGAKVYPENLTNNYISNVGFFKRYGQQLYGLTGTLGDQTSLIFLEKLYQVDTVVLPPFRKKQHLELVPKIMKTEGEWYTDITTNAISMLNSGRAVLIITKYILEINAIYDKFKQFNYDTSKVILFRTDEDVNVIDKVIRSGEVILTTNIAGRGTDIRLHPTVDEYGGLHVCLTFLPINTRVEMQNIGRTSRTGNRGTSQLILLNDKLNIEKIKNERDITQHKKITKCQEDVEIILIKEKIFTEFLRLLEVLKCRNEKFGIVEKKAVKERFAIWLKMEAKIFKTEKSEKIMQHFNFFKEEILKDDSGDVLIKNPYFHVWRGNFLLHHKEYKDAIKEYSLAIKLDQNFAENAYYNRAFCFLAEYGSNAKNNMYYIDDAIGDLKKARKLLENREAELHLLQRVSDSEAFSEQIQHKMNLYNTQKQAIDAAIGPDKDAINSQIATLNKRFEEKLSSDEEKEIIELVETLKKERNRKGIIVRTRENNRNFETKLVALSELLPDDDMKTYEEEVEEFENNGFIGGFKITEIKPIDWKSVFGLMVLGLGQLIAGAALAVYTLGAGATFAMNLISEGISDIITAIKDGIINRDFSWASWAVQKAISITIAVVCAGMSAMKDVAKTCSAGASKLIGNKVLDETVKSGWKLVAKKVGTELAKGIVKEVVTDLANYGIEYTLMAAIQDKLLELTETPIQNALMSNTNVEMLLRMDIHNKNNKYECFITSTAFNILDTSCKSQLLNIAKQIGLGIADRKVKYFTAARQISEAVLALNELRTLVPELLSNLEKKLNEKVSSEDIIKKIDKIESISNENIHNNIDNTKYQHSTTTTRTPNGDMEPDEKGDIDLNVKKEKQVKIVKPNTDPSKLCKVVTNGVNSKMLSIIKGKLINPVVQAGVNYSMEKLTADLDKTINHDIENYRSLKRVIHSQDKGFKTPSKSKTLNTNVDENDPSVKYARQLIKKSEDGGNSGLQDMGGISDQIQKPIHVYDEKGRVKFRIGENNKGKPVEVQHHADSDHYTLLGSKEPKTKGKGKNMCLYNVIAEQTGNDPDQLKQNNISWMKANIHEYAKQSSDISRLMMYDNLKLCMGGAKYDPKLGSKYYLDNSQGKMADYKKKRKNRPPGHPRGHASDPTATEPNSSAELYSEKDINNPDRDVEKTAFMSKEAQDYICDIAMSHPETAARIKLLNEGSYREEFTLTKEQLNLQNKDLNKAGKWLNGKKEYTYEVEDIRLVLGHHEGKYKDPDADVFITTVFPHDTGNKHNDNTSKEPDIG